MRRRDVMTLAGGAAAWPLAARAQGDGPIRRLGVLMSLSPGNAESNARLAIFLRALNDNGWVAGRVLEAELRWCGDDPERARLNAQELLAMSPPPEVFLASGSVAASALAQATRSVPIVFVQVAEPLGGGLVTNFAKPGGNITGIASIDYGVSGRWLDLLKEIAPTVTRVLAIRDSDSNAGKVQYGAIEKAAQARGVEVSAVGVRDGAEIERAIAAHAAAPNGGLIVTTSTRASAHRARVISATAQHRLPAVYPFRFYAVEGGLVSYGADWADQYRRAAAFVDRILRGEKPGDLPVQEPAKFELVISLKTAKALGLTVPLIMQMTADEVIE